MLSAIEKLPEGYSEGIYEDQKYGIIKTVFNEDKSLKVSAKELGGNNFISLNYYIIPKNNLLRPCEMSNQKVIHFLQNVVITASKSINVKFGEIGRSMRFDQVTSTVK